MKVRIEIRGDNCLFLTVFQMFTSVRVLRLSNVNLTNQGLNKIFTDLCENLLKVR